MVRKFIPCDSENLRSEFRRLESPSRQKLMYAMERYQGSYVDVEPAVVKNEYPEGILEIRHQNGFFKRDAVCSSRKAGGSLYCWWCTANISNRLREGL